MATGILTENCTEHVAGTMYEIILEEVWQAAVTTDQLVYWPWVFSLLGSTMVGLAGIFPLLVIPIDEGADLKNGASAGTLKILLSFAVGGLLGDVFLHLLPEAWGNDAFNRAHDKGHPSMVCGLWVLSGFLVFVIIEKIFAFDGERETDELLDVSKEQVAKGSKESMKQNAHEKMENNNCISVLGDNPRNGLSKCYSARNEFTKNVAETQLQLGKKMEKTNGYVPTANGFKTPRKNGFVQSLGHEHANGASKTTSPANDEVQIGANDPSKTNGYAKKPLLNGYAAERKKSLSNYRKASVVATKEKPKHVTGYLNLMANCIDNFTHGLAVGGSFLVSFRLGALTTFAILVHEIPHEVGDFAILLRSGFSRWDAARAQLLTASGGIFGALAAVLCSGGGIEARTSWILPFTAGGFLHIGLVTILPELLQETSPRESLKQLGFFVFGVILMAALTILCD